MQVAEMIKTAYVRARIEPDLKTQAEAIFNELGVTVSQVINMLYRQVSRKHAIPLELGLPNKKTARAIDEARTGKGVIVCKNADDLFDKLGI